MSSQARLGARTPMDVGSFYSLMGGNGKPNRRQSWPLKSLGQYARLLLEKLVGSLGALAAERCRAKRPQPPPAGAVSLGHTRNSKILHCCRNRFRAGELYLPRIGLFQMLRGGPDGPTPPPKSPIGRLNWSGLSAIAPRWGRFFWQRKTRRLGRAFVRRLADKIEQAEALEAQAKEK